jgi:putative transposase
MSRKNAPASTDTSTRVLRLRLKDKHAADLREMASAVNTVWNYCNNLGMQVLDRERRFMTGFDFQKYLNGASKEGLAVGSAVFQQVAEEFATRRRQFGKRRLRWRVSNPKRSNYSLGWIPFKARSLTYKAGQIRFQGLLLGLWDSYGLADYELGAGSICEDSRGRWYLNVTVKIARKALPVAAPIESLNAVGIDLGLKDLYATSDGATVEAKRFYRDLEHSLATAQRVGKKRRVKAIHAKIANRRKDALHKASTKIVRKHGAIFVGNVNASALAKTPAAKSVLDAGWSTFRTMLAYKSDDAGRWFAEIDEAYSTQDCSSCGSRTGPRGQAQLDVRRWSCPTCGTEHQRDINAAVNIRNRGLAWLEGVFAAAAEAKASEPAVNEACASTRAGAGHGPLAAGIPVLQGGVDVKTRCSSG